MQAKITQSVVQSIAPQQKTFRVCDTLLKGLILVVRPTGKKTWYVDYRRPNGKRTDHLIGVSTLFSVAEAREQAREFLAAVARGEDPTEAKEEALILGQFIENIYGPWITDNKRTGKDTLKMLRSNFKFLFEYPLEQVSISQIEQWRTRRKKKDGVKSSSLNRVVGALQTALNWAVKRGMLESNPLSKLERLSESDTVQKVRYLSNEDRARLLKALDDREKEQRQARESHNKWCEERHQPALPILKEGHFVDHLKPVILLSLNTGIRRNAVLSLLWGDINFVDKIILVRAATSKSEKQYYVSMNETAYETLTTWKKQSGHVASKDLVFPSPQTGKKMDNCNTAWEGLLKRADIESFRWHDMRHDFASQLVMKGVDLNTVRELMGHADLKMTLRYAHLAPENKLRAVKILDA